jgi:hypothetical protein
MKQVTQSLLSFACLLSVPATAEEFNSFLAPGDTLLGYAIDEAYYRGVAPKVRSKFLELIKIELNKEPAVTSEKTVGEGDKAKVVKTYEKDTAFIKRIQAEGVSVAQLQPLAQQAFDAVGWDLSSTRSSGPNKKDQDAADFYIQAVANGETNWDRLTTNFETANLGLKIAREEDGSIAKDIMSETCRVNRLRMEALAAGGMM